MFLSLYSSLGDQFQPKQSAFQKYNPLGQHAALVIVKVLRLKSSNP